MIQHRQTRMRHKGQGDVPKGTLRITEEGSKRKLEQNVFRSHLWLCDRQRKEEGFRRLGRSCCGCVFHGDVLAKNVHVLELFEEDTVCHLGKRCQVKVKCSNSCAGDGDRVKGNVGR